MTFDINLKNELEASGRLWLRNAISEDDLEHFDAAALLDAKPGARVKPSHALSAALDGQGTLMQSIRSLDPMTKPVRTVAFNKTPDTNWGVPWHQDRVIAVADKHEVTGFDKWTNKSGVWHCEPPQHVLDEMLFVRIHLDDTDHDNGAMEIAVGSHVHGVVPAANAADTALQHPIESCEAKRGDVLVLKMLTLHGSKPSKVSSNRRVFRIDFASKDLPAPLSWG